MTCRSSVSDWHRRRGSRALTRRQKQRAQARMGKKPGPATPSGEPSRPRTRSKASKKPAWETRRAQETGIDLSLRLSRQRNEQDNLSVLFAGDLTSVNLDGFLSLGPHAGIRSFSHYLIAAWRHILEFELAFLAGHGRRLFLVVGIPQRDLNSLLRPAVFAKPDNAFDGADSRWIDQLHLLARRRGKSDAIGGHGSQIDRCAL